MVAGHCWHAWRSGFLAPSWRSRTAFFRDAILEVGVDRTKGKMLPLRTAAVLEGIVCKLSVVAVVVEDADAVLLGKVYECALGFHGFFRSELGHEVNVLELGV
jgi:hypothetical protein